MGVLNAIRVDAVFGVCYFREDDHPSEQIVVGGLGILVTFHAKRIGQSLRYIREMLAELPDEFKTERVEFHKACVDRSGNRWVSRTIGVGELTVEKLV